MTHSPMTGLPALPNKVRIREVGPRDGLQAEAPLPAEDRARLIEALVAAGARDVEAVAFVSPKAVPAMADAQRVLDLVPRTPDVRYLALVPNLFGAERAVEAGVDGLTFTLSASPTYNERNVKMTVEESLGALRAICALAGCPDVDAVVSCAFGSPYEGEIAASDVTTLVNRCFDAGAPSVTLADTTGMATPRRVADVIGETGSDVGLHLHETRATGLVNAYAALQLGVERFDTSVGGLGGSPFAAGAAGNLATEEFVHLLDDLGVGTGFDLDRLIEAALLAAELVGHAVPSRVATAGPRSRLASG